MKLTKQRLQTILNWTLTKSIFLWTLSLAVFVFGTSYLRLGEAFRDFGLSVKFFFCQLFHLPNSTPPTVTEYSDVLSWQLLPEEWNGFLNQAREYFSLLFSGKNFRAYEYAITDKLEVFAKAGLVLLPCVLILYLAIRRLYQSCNTKHNKDTVPLVLFKRYAKAYYQPAKRFIIGYISFLKERLWIIVVLALIWVCSLNLATVIIEFFPSDVK